VYKIYNYLWCCSKVIAELDCMILHLRACRHAKVTAILRKNCCPWHKLQSDDWRGSVELLSLHISLDSRRGGFLIHSVCDDFWIFLIVTPLLDLREPCWQFFWEAGSQRCSINVHLYAYMHTCIYIYMNTFLYANTVQTDDWQVKSNLVYYMIN